MANIPRLSPGLVLIANVRRAGIRPYGSYCSATVVPGDFAVLADNTGTKLCLVKADGSREVELAQLNPVVLPYANRFLQGTGVSVIKDWRTGNYRLKAAKAAKVRQSASAVVKPAPVPTVEVQPSADIIAKVASEMVQPKAATITIAAAGSESKTLVAPTVADPIPGMVYPSGVAPKLKGAGRGWTDVAGVVVPTTDYEALSRAWTLRQKGEIASVIITGPAGTAKTMLVRSFAAVIGVPYLKVDCSAVRTADDWSGSYRQDPNTKTWAHQWSPFARALRAGQPCIILLDELTRTESPAALNALLGLLDETGTLLVPDANAVLTMPKGILIVATANIGPEFVGTLPLDGAVRQRFEKGVRMNYPTESIEAKLLATRFGVTNEVAEALVRMAVQQRLHRDDAQQYPSGNVISTRMLLAIAKDIGLASATPRDAVWTALKAQFDPADEAALSVVVDATFPKNPVPSAPPVEGNPATFVVGKHWYSDGSTGMTGTPCQFNVLAGPACGRLRTDPVHY